MAWAPAVAAVVVPLIMQMMNKDKDKTSQLPTMSPEGQDFLKQIFGMLGSQGNVGQGMGEGVSLMRQLMDPSSAAVNDFAQPYMDQFNQQTIPGLSERFAGAGALGGGLSSSGFGQSLSAAGGKLQHDLAALKGKLGMGAAESLMSMFSNLSGQGLNARPFGYQHQQGGPSAGQSALASWGQQGYPGATEGWNALLDSFSKTNNNWQTGTGAGYRPAQGG